MSAVSDHPVPEQRDPAACDELHLARGRAHVGRGRPAQESTSVTSKEYREAR